MYPSREYGLLMSIRKRAREVNELLNRIVAEFGKSIEWHKRLGYHNIKPLQGKFLIYFRFRGNQYVKRMELLSYNLDLLRSIRGEFAEYFKAELEIKEGWL